MSIKEYFGAADPTAAPLAAQVLGGPLAMTVYPESVITFKEALYALGRLDSDKTIKHLIVAARQGSEHLLDTFKDPISSIKIDGDPVKTFPLTHDNALALKAVLPFLIPSLVGLRTSIGCGDRLGLATPGHLQAVKGTGLFPVLAQQSIREMSRTGRSANEVIDDAMWGVFQCGWMTGYGSDADHLKTTEDIDLCAAAGFTMYTIDPGEQVDNNAESDYKSTLEKKIEALPWVELETTLRELRLRYSGKKFKMANGLYLEFTSELVSRTAVKFGKAIIQTTKMYRHLLKIKGEGNFELELSLDETESPTTPLEHFFVASELRHLGVKWVSLAPRFTGGFEKGVDYQGSHKEFERSFASHLAVARFFGDYKISIHSGSDKFTIYPIAAQIARGSLHLKTAGTSWLEALRVAATVAPTLYRRVYAFALTKYEADRKSYNVSADLFRVPDVLGMLDPDLAATIDQFDARQMLHVTFGSILSAKKDSGEMVFKTELFKILRENEETHHQMLAKHLGRHAQPFKVKEQQHAVEKS